MESYEENNVIENIKNEYSSESKSNYDEYACGTCGAKLIADDTTTITDCAYCGSRQILKAKFQGDFNPVEIIPFKIDREQFIKSYEEYFKTLPNIDEKFKEKSKRSKCYKFVFAIFFCK